MINQRRWRVMGHVVPAVVLAAIAAAVGLYLFTAMHRMRYPFELEWMEGGILEHVKRVVSGQPVYAAPSLGFTAFIYNPLYYYVAAPLCALFGLGLFPLRLVSFVASIGSFLLLFSLVRKHTGQLLAGAVAAGLFAATFVVGGSWFDLARIDSLGLALLLAAAYPLVAPDERPSRLRRALIASAVLAALAILTKQSAALVAPVLLLRAFTLGRWRAAALFGGAVMLLLGLAVLALQLRSHGWYWYYAFELPSTHTMAGHNLITDFWRYELFGAVPVAAATGSLELLAVPFARPGKTWFLPASAAALLLLGYVTRLHMGSYLNDVMPAHAGLAILSASFLGRLAVLLHPSPHAAPTWLAGALQIVLLFYSPSGHIPSKSSRDTGWGVVAWLRAQPGEVWVVSHPYLNTLAGKPSHLHFMALIDIELGTRDPRGARAALHREIDAALANRRFSRVVLDDDWFFHRDTLLANYTLDSPALIRDETALWPLTGTRLRPTQIFRRDDPQRH